MLPVQDRSLEDLMRKLGLFSLVLCLLGAGKALANATTAADHALRHMFEDEWHYQMVESPEWATWVGFPGQDSRWTDNSRVAIGKREAHTRAYLKSLKGLSRAKLSPSEQLNYDLALRQAEEQVEGQKFHGDVMPINQMSGPHQDIAQLLSMQSATKLADYRDILTRLKGVPTVIDQTIDLMNEGLKLGITPPKVTLRDVPDQIKAQIVEDPTTSPMLEAFKKIPDSISAADQDKLRAEAKTTYLSAVAPAFEKLHKFFVETYLPKANEKIGLSSLPNGAEWYQHNIRVETTTNKTPAEIHAIGLAEVKRIRGKMDEVIQKLEYKGDFKEFTEFLRNDDQFFYTDADSLLAGYRDIAKRIDPELPKLFGRLPRLPYGVKQVPSYAEKSQTTAYYNQGSPDSGRAGTFFANTYNLKARPKWEMEALTLHEAVPGHHLQISLAQEMTNVPEFRKNTGYTAYVEGWGLYSESLGEELGFYKDPYSKFGQLTYEMWRAVRLVVDTGMHSLGWSRQQAIDYFTANTGKSEHDIEVEIDRYIVWPGQALAYKIGELKLKELRAKATAELGARFDIRTFHDELLRNGALPLDVLEAHMNQWMTSQRMASH